MTNATDHVVLTDTQGKILGIEEKMAAHQKGLLHLAFSIFIFNEKGEMLLQQRAMTKYHFGGIWSNTCCSHPRLGETLEAAAHRRLQEELGFDTTLKQAFSFIYRAEDPVTGLIEHELDTVFLGFYELPVINFNVAEINAIRFISLPDLYIELSIEPEKFSLWFKIALHELEERQLLAAPALKKWLNMP